MTKTLTGAERAAYEELHPCKEKKCSYCDKVRPIKYFGINRHGYQSNMASFYQSRCKDCINGKSRTSAVKIEAETALVLPTFKAINEATLEDLMPRLRELGVESITVSRAIKL